MSLNIIGDRVLESYLLEYVEMNPMAEGIIKLYECEVRDIEPEPGEDPIEYTRTLVRPMFREGEFVVQVNVVVYDDDVPDEVEDEEEFVRKSICNGYYYTDMYVFYPTFSKLDVNFHQFVMSKLCKIPTKSARK